MDATLQEDGKPTSLVPCDSCEKGWPLNSLIYLELPTGETANLCCWDCLVEYALNQLDKEDHV